MYSFSEGRKDSDGKIYLTEPEPFAYEDLPDNLEHVVRDGETLYSLAGRYFRNFKRPAGLFWVIAGFQPEPIHDPTIALRKGSVLIIPSELTVQTRVFSERRRT